jgi:hypothetical protein
MPPTNPDDRVSPNPLGPKRRAPAAGEPEPMESLPSFARGSGGGGLNSLAQSARQKQLKNARWTLIIVGALTVVLNVAAFFLINTQVNDAVRIQGLNRANLPAEMQAQIAIAYVSTGAFAVLGIVFIVLGIMVYSYPVPCTITGLVLYILGFVASLAAAAISGAPMETQVTGIIIKIIIVVALFKAVQAAIAYQRDAEVAAEPELD